MDEESNQNRNSSRPLIVLTGAAGRLGIPTHRALLDAGKTVRAVDRVRHAQVTDPLIVADLSKPAPCRRIFQGADVLVHLAYRQLPFESPHGYPSQAFDEHIQMNRQVFQTACEAGVKKIIFSSSIQVISRQFPDLSATSPPRSLPLNENTPAEPDNWYSLAKLCSEEMLATLHRMHGVDCITLRFPSLAIRDADQPMFQERTGEGFSYLTYRDAADALLKVVDTDLPGYRIYTPASRKNGRLQPAPEVIRDFYPDVPLRKPPGEIDCLVDFSSLTRDTGWEPRDLDQPTIMVRDTVFRRLFHVLEKWLPESVRSKLQSG